MKTFVLIPLAFVAVCISNAQCPTEIYFIYQDEIDDFQLNYPGCTKIEGDVYIGNGNDYITNLNGLNALTYVGGNLSIYGNSNLESLTGLEGLDSIGGSIIIYDNYNLSTNLTELQGLEFIGGGLNLFNNHSLSACDAEWICNYLMSPNGSVEIHNNAEGCNSVIEIASACGGSMPCLPFGNYYLSNQSDIDNFQYAFPSCSEPAGDISINGNNILNLNGLNLLTSVNGNLRISTTNLTSLDGLEYLSSVNGDLWIFGNSSLSGLTSLEGLDTIGGNLSIFSNDNLLSLSGLEGLQFIGGYISIGSNSSLINLTGLESLSSINGDLWISGNSSLSDLTGLEGLDSIHGSLGIGIPDDMGPSGNGLSNLSGLDELSFIGGSLQIYGNWNLTSLSGLNPEAVASITDLSIIENHSLSTCDALWLCEYLSDPGGSVNIYKNEDGCNNPAEVADNCGIALPCLPYGNYYFFSQTEVDNFQSDYPECTDIAGNVIIRGTDITSLYGLNIVTSIAEDLSIGHAWLGGTALGDLSGLESLNYVGGQLNIRNNTALAGLTGLDGLDSIGRDLFIISNNALESLAGLENLNITGGDLRIEDNYILSNLTGLNGLTHLSESLIVGDNFSLTELTGLENLESIGGDLFIQENKSLAALTGLDELDSVQGGLRILSNRYLTGFTGLEALSFIGGDVWIGYNNLLNDLSALEGLNSIGGGLYLTENSSLVTLSGLQDLTSIGGFLSIYNNNVLTSLEGLDNIDESSISGISIAENNLLSECSVTSICNYLAIPGGFIEIYNNDPGCNSPEEVEAECAVGFEENKPEDHFFNVYPNPASGKITIEQYRINHHHTTLSLFNSQGSLILQTRLGKTIESLDISELPNGIYLLRLTQGDLVQTEKVIKQ